VAGRRRAVCPSSQVEGRFNPRGIWVIRGEWKHVDKMIAAAITGPGRVELLEQPVPRAFEDLVVVKILVSPLCTEFKDRRDGGVSNRLGHEAAGVVEDPGRSKRFVAGDRVVVMPQYACGRCWLCQRGDHIYCRNQRDVLAESGSGFGLATMAQYILKPDWLLLPVPDDVALEHAVMACCGFGPTFSAHNGFQTTGLDTVVVSGCGPVGLGGIIQATVRGARVFGIEMTPYRASLARQLGAADVFDPSEAEIAAEIRELTDGRGADSGIETSGAPTAARLLASTLRVRGRMAVVADLTPELTVPAVRPTGLEVFGCWHWNHQAHLPEMWKTIRKADTAIDTMITHTFDLDQVSTAMDVQDTGECGKILLYPFGREVASAEPSRSTA
jgi:L-iditol 2-dehydrogenase